MSGPWRREEIESPCVQVCLIHPETRLCVGCRRTGEEIARWTAMTAEERRRIIEELPARVVGSGRRGGRAGRRNRTDG